MSENGSDRLTVVFAGGGTGGHLFPGIAIADEVKRRIPGAEIIFVGTRGKIEERVVPAAGYRFAPIWISAFNRSLRWPLLLFPLKLVVSLVQSFMLLRRVWPDVVVGTGGYVCGPPVYVASLLGIPTILQEQNSYPGVTTRMLAGRATEVHLTFDSSRRFVGRAKAVFVTGNPVRSTMGASDRQSAAAFFGLDPSVPTVLVFGGSLGATSINNAFRTSLDALLRRNVQVIWQTGRIDAIGVQNMVATTGEEAQQRVKVLPFIERMDLAFAASDVAICRAGATTLAELALAGLPSILVPYPFAAADHQTENARAMVQAGAALLCADKEAADQLLPLLQSLLDNPAKREEMARKARAMAKPEAARTLADAVIRLGRRGDE